jgi:diguanylate cyclase (GGDEF)-like protein/PAS domain S-box-containing protein
MPSFSHTPPTAFDVATSQVLEAQYATAERIANVVRIGVLGLLGVVAGLWAPSLTSDLNLVNLAVLAPMLSWAVAQHVAVHARRRSWRHLSRINTYVDITAVSALLLGYGLLGMPDLAVKSPIWTAYFVILAARPFTGSPRHAALASVAVAVQYAAIAAFFVGTERLVRLDTPLSSVSASGTSLLDETAKVVLLVVGGIVVTYATAWNERTLRRSIEAMKASDARFRAVFEHAAVGIALLDGTSGIVATNGAFEKFLGAPDADVRGRRLADFAPAEESDTASELIRAVADGRRDNAAAEVRFVRGDGHLAWGSLTVSRAEGKDDLRLIVMVQDVSARKALEAELLHQAFHDPLTELANRALFQDRVNHALVRTERGPERIAVLFLDLDNFKNVNDTQGHAAGDRLLQVVAARLLNATRGCDTVARLGGDEFAVLIEHVQAVGGVEIVAERIVNSLRQPVETAPGRSLTISASLGIAVARGTEGTGELLRNADVAMYEAKNRARGRWVTYDPEMHAALVDRVTLEADLRRAVDRSEFHLAYQPIVDLASGRLTGIEALLRWTHPERGAVPPPAFIGLAEECGVIVPLGRWVLREACRQAAAWNGRPGARPLTVAVNLSGKQLQHESLLRDVEAALGESGLSAHCLVLEITESVIMHETATTLTRLNQLKRLGVRLAIDDFGTGYSSLSYLQQFPVDILKIDRSFTEGLLRGDNDAALVRTIVALGDMLTLHTIAEGVEDASQEEQLRRLGCDAAQGFLFSRPMLAGQIDALLAAATDARETGDGAPPARAAAAALPG